MQFWSKGLGKKCLNIQCGSEIPEVEKGKVRLRGVTKPPLSWEYTISMGGDDWLGFFEVAFHPTIVKYLMKPSRLGLALKAFYHLTMFLIVYIAVLPVAMFLPVLEEQDIVEKPKRRTRRERKKKLENLVENEGPELA